MFRRFSALSLVVLFALAFAPAYAQQANSAPNTIVVTNLNDSGPGSLRQAIADAQTGSVVTFTSGLTGTITLAQTLSITKDLSIIGPNSRGISVSGNNSNTVIAVSSNVHFSIAYMVVENGKGEAGGLVNNTGGSVTISNSIFQNNSNGAVLNLKNSTTNIDTTSFVQNVSLNYPVLENLAGSVTISDSDFEGNKPTILDNVGQVVIRSSLFRNNGAFGHTMIENADVSSLTIVNSTFQGNIGVLRNGGSATLINNTLANNNIMAAPTIASISLNTTIINTIILSDPGAVNCGGAVVDGGGNIQFPGKDCGPGVLVADPKLAPLADNGGPTQTMALLPGSPAIGTALFAVCKNVEVSGIDQRGMLRPTSCDIGAFQTGAIPAVATSSATIVPTGISTVVATASISK